MQMHEGDIGCQDKAIDGSYNRRERCCEPFGAASTSLTTLILEVVSQQSAATAGTVMCGTSTDRLESNVERLNLQTKPP